MPNRMQELFKQNLLSVNAEVIRLQDEVAHNPEHWLHDGLKAYFEARQQQLVELKR